MKRLLPFLAAMGLSLSAFGQANNGIVHSSASFLNGLGNLIVSNNTTVNFTSTNVPFVSPFGALIGSYTNAQVIYTNAAGTWTNLFYTPGHLIDVVYPFSDANGQVSTNLSITVAFNNTNLFLPTTYGGLPNPNNNNNVTNWLPPIAVGSATTNTVTFTFWRCCDDTPVWNSPQTYATYVQPVVANTSIGGTLNMYDTNNTFQFAIALTNYTAGSFLVFNTNLPASFLVGAKSIRCGSIVTSSAASSAGVIINQLKLSGWHP